MVTVNGKVYEEVGAIQGDIKLAKLTYNKYASCSIFFPIEVGTTTLMRATTTTGS
jgi:hypothetical protein